MKYTGFYDTEMARRYLVGSVIRVNDDPVYVTDVGEARGGGINIYYYFLKNKREDKVNVYDNSVSLAPVPLGLCNVGLGKEGRKTNTVHISRTPMRAWKIGLSVENMAVFSVGTSEPPRFNGMTLITSENLHNTIKGLYPSLEELMKLLKKEREGSSAAFARNFALKKVRKDRELLVYSSRVEESIGVCVDEEILLNKEFVFLKESLEELDVTVRV